MKPRWGILGTGNVARQFAKATLLAQGGILAAAGSRFLSSAESLAAICQVPWACGCHDAVLADADIDASPASAGFRKKE